MHVLRESLTTATVLSREVRTVYAAIDPAVSCRAGYLRGVAFASEAGAALTNSRKRSVSALLREGSQRGNINPVPLTAKPSAPPPAQGATQRKPSECDKNQEIEKIKRLLHNLIDRVDALKTK